MKRVAAAFLLLSGLSLLFFGFHTAPTRNVHAGQVSPVGAPAPQLRDNLPSCNSTLDGVQFWSRATGITTTCDAVQSAWIAPPYQNPAPVAFYVNGALQSPTTKCGFGTGTTSAAGTLTFNPTTILGPITTLVGTPQPAVNIASAAPATVNITGTPTTTAVNVYATGGSAVTILTISLVAFNAGALPVSLFVCGR